MKYHAFLVLIVVFFLTGLTLAGPLTYSDGVLMIRFAKDFEPEINTEAIVSVDDVEIDRLLDRFNAYGLRDYLGGYISKDEDYLYETRNNHIIVFPSGTDMELVAEEFSRLSEVVWAEPDFHYPVCYTPNDPSLGSQWWLGAIEAERAWDIVTGSESVIVAGIDTGVDWNHPDLAENIWVNPGEDMDDDHRPFGDLFDDLPGTAGDWNDIDDDDNGLVDDFIGYDWIQGINNAANGEDGLTRDNNPIDFNGHGTGVAAAMAAAGDNGIGGASIAYGCKIMALRCGYETAQGNGVTVSTAYIPAIRYAVENGAKVLNMSFGSNQSSQGTDNALQAAWEDGALLFAATGNDGRTGFFFPAAYNNVISVAATSTDGGRAGFSNWGDWVDVAAPGVGCYTPWFNNTYTSWDGTSVASPIAAGVGALVISMFPNQSNSYWTDVVVNTTDPINTNRPIGSGEVNAYKAVTQYYWPELVIEEWSMTDPNGNGHPDVGEEIEVRLNVSNQVGWQTATFTTASISLSYPGVRIDVPSVQLGILEGGDEVDNNDSPLSFTIPEGGPDGHFSTFNLTVTASPHNYSIGVSKTIMLGTPDIILIDDDGGADYDRFIREDLHQHFYNYFHHDISVMLVSPSGDELAEYDAIIWMTGDETDPLNDAEIEALQHAMDEGTNLFMFGQTLDEQLDGTEFYSDYLFARSGGEAENEVGLEAVSGVEGPIIPESRMVLVGPGGAGNGRNSPDIIEPLGDASSAYEYLTMDGDGGIFYEDDDRKHVYFSFAFEAVTGGSETALRHEVMSSILSWFDVAEVPDNTEPAHQIPDEFDISSVYPNPFNSSTNLKIHVPYKSDVKLDIYDILGRQVTTLINRSLSPGTHSIKWDADNLAAGVYFAILESPGKSMVKKLAYIK
ncbi:MAG: S8/S53 family peptidase [Candidatus Electryonea clarkiae]|nr:S8/S53 family peptidase [Candidatus Electryonea clarkiae]MDP8289086.1 S8/S53 family peptidase [Candidatus Electryonea clarkiae]